MQIIAGQNVSPNSMPGPTGFGFGSGHNPNAAAVMMNNSGVAPTTSKTRPTLTHVDLRYWLMADCGLTVELRGRPEAPTKRRGRTLSSRARGADPLDVHGPLQRSLGADILVDLSEYVTAGHKSPKSTVVTVIAVVTHHEERVSWHANP